MVERDGRMTKDEVKKYLTNELNPLLDIKPDKIDMNGQFIEDFGFDSLDFVLLMENIEEIFNIDIPDSEFNNLKIPNNLINYINFKISIAID